MTKEEKLQLQGEVVEALPNAMFRVRITPQKEVLGYISGKMRTHYIKIVPGDQVTIEFSPYNLNRGRITRRL